VTERSSRPSGVTIALAVIVAIGALLRWLSPGRIALWRDEAQYLAIASLPDVQSIVSFLYRHESHPPLYYLLGRAAQAVFGTVEGPMAALSALASVAVIAVVGTVGSRAFSPAAGLIAASATALSMPLVILTVQLRPYALLALLVLVSHSSLWAYWSGRGERWLYVWFGSTVLIPYLHHVSVLILAGQAIIVGWLQWRGMPLERFRWRKLLQHATLLALLAIPSGYLLLAQATTAAYPSPKPFSILRPFLALGVLSLSFPLELLLPLLVLLAAGLGLLSRTRRVPVFDGARPLLTAATPVFLLLATLATYRSQFLVPHLLLSMAPFGMLLAGAYIAGTAAAGRRLQAAVWGEAVVTMVVIGFLFATGFAKTNTDLVARSVAAAAHPDDLVVLVPGAAGASFNRYFTGSNSRIDFPAVGQTPLYKFDADFARISDPRALQMARDSVRAAFDGGRRVWLVTIDRWVNSRVPTPELLSRDSFGGLGQADRSRANRLERYARWLYGPPAQIMTTDTTLPAYEQLVARLYARKPDMKLRTSDSALARDDE